MPKRGRPKIEINLQAAVEAYHRRKSAVLAAKDLGISDWTLYRILKENGVELVYQGRKHNPSRTQAHIDRWQKIKAAVDSGRPMKEITAEFKITRQRVFQILRKLKSV